MSEVSAPTGVKVSIIVPAHNAAATIAETLDSVLAQTFASWEAIVVDDGSNDGTSQIAAHFASRDPRVRVVGQSQRGECGARNTGVRLSRFEWLLFLDSDDWVVPEYLERMTDVLRADPTLDAVHCRWARVTPDGRRSVSSEEPGSGDLFSVLAVRNPFAVHACIVRRSLVIAVGGFDESLRTAGDWDLWQKVARTGARFGRLDEVMALYRVRAGSMSSQAPRLLADCLQVIERGHSPDPRVPLAITAHPDGQSGRDLASTRYFMLAWCGGLLLGREEDATGLIGLLGGEREPNLSADSMAACLFTSVPLGTCRTPDDWPGLWPRLESRISHFLEALEVQSKADGLRRRTLVALEGFMAVHGARSRLMAGGLLEEVVLEITDPIADRVLRPNVERLRCAVEMGGHRIGAIEVPVFDGQVPGAFLADAVAAQLAWPILIRYFEHTVYRELEIKSDPRGLAIWRGAVCLATGASEEGAWEQVRGDAGWLLFLQELWGHPDWTAAQFDATARPSETTHRIRVEDDHVTIEAAYDLPELAVSCPSVNVILAVGGVAIGMVTVRASGGLVSVPRLRAELIRAGGFELCRAAVRGSLLGRRTAEGSLLSLLRSAADRRSGAGQVACLETDQLLVAPEFAHGRASTDQTAVFCRRAAAQIGTSVSRRAVLPRSAFEWLAEAALLAREPLLWCDREEIHPAHVVYAPDAIARTLLPVVPPQRLTRGRAFLPAGGPIHELGSRSRLALDTLRRAIERTAQRVRRRASGWPPAFRTQLPILMYHQVVPTDAAPGRYRVSVKEFEDQLRFLRKLGCRSVTLDQWRVALEARKPLDDQSVAITFDDGYRDFMTHAWPLLRRYGFSATVFLVTDRIGMFDDWNHGQDSGRLLGWDDIRKLRDEGVVFGSHSATHQRLTLLSPTDVVKEAARSRATLQRGLDRPVRLFAYPHGDTDSVVENLVGACGYTLGVSTRPALSVFGDQLLGLPRIEVRGSDGVAELAAAIGA